MWKNVKEHYSIGHIVSVTDRGICIGSSYIPDLIVIGLDGNIIKSDAGKINEDLQRYMAEFKADLAKLKELVTARDTFSKSLPVFTYEGSNIIEEQCEKYGWPNVTHEGRLMYENTYSKSKSKVVAWAKQSAESELKWLSEQLKKDKASLAELEKGMVKAEHDLATLKADYP